MTKKISILAIIFSGILSENLYAETKNEKNTGTVGSEVVNTQGYINKRNVLNPNTYDDLNPLITNKAVNKESDINGVYGWNATPKGDIFAYTLKDDNGNTVEGVNCLDENEDGKGDTKPFKGNKYCSTIRQIEAGETGNDGSCKAKDADGNEYALTIPYGYKCENSYIIPDGYVKKAEKPKKGSKYREYFYRYWMSGTEAKKFCEPAFRSIGCWSPAYPIIAYNGFTGFNIPNTEAGAELAKTAFGTREPGDKDFEFNGIKNAYRNIKGESEYRMGVKVTAVTEKDSAGKAVPKGGYHTDSDANLTVQKWEIDSGKGLKPDFNYLGSSSTDIKAIDYIDDLSSTSKAETSILLPCGMFTEASSRPNGVELNKGVKCASDHMQILRDNLGPLYTKYNILLPTGNGFESSSNRYLNARTCAKCENMTEDGNCEKLVLQLIDGGITNVNDLVK